VQRGEKEIWISSEAAEGREENQYKEVGQPAKEENVY